MNRRVRDFKVAVAILAVATIFTPNALAGDKLTLSDAEKILSGGAWGLSVKYTNDLYKQIASMPNPFPNFKSFVKRPVKIEREFIYRFVTMDNNGKKLSGKLMITARGKETRAIDYELRAAKNSFVPFKLVYTYRRRKNVIGIDLTRGVNSLAMFTVLEPVKYWSMAYRKQAEPASKPNLATKARRGGKTTKASADWEFGYGQTGRAFTAFGKFDEKNKRLKGVLTASPAANTGERFLYAMQNTTNVKVQDPVHRVAYPAKDKGTVVLHPGNKNDAKIRYSPNAAGTYRLIVEWELMDDDARKKGQTRFSVEVGVWINGKLRRKSKAVLNGKKLKHFWNDRLALKKNDKVIIGVHSKGTISNDSTFVTASAVVEIPSR